MIFEGSKEGVIATEILLKEAGFTVSQACCSRPSCFDLATRKDGPPVLIKVQHDIDNLSIMDSDELKSIARSLSTHSLLVSGRSRNRPLEDDTVYSRYGVAGITTKTLEDMMIRNEYPLIQAGPGGYYVDIDGAAIRRRRQELGYSVGDVAKTAGISRGTLYCYERGIAKASVHAAFNLVCSLGIPVAKTINPFGKSYSDRKCALLLKAKKIFARNKLLTKILLKAKQCRVTTVRKAPFDFVITAPEREIRIIGGVTVEKEPELDKRIEEILSVSRVLQSRSVLITMGEELANHRILCIYKDELSEMKTAEDMIARVT